ncbi:hypothetical protein MTO96_005252 [Rhipicephalus appendiculatus]
MIFNSVLENESHFSPAGLENEELSGSKVNKQGGWKGRAPGAFAQCCLQTVRPARRVVENAGLARARCLQVGDSCGSFAVVARKVFRSSLALASKRTASAVGEASLLMPMLTVRRSASSRLRSGHRAHSDVPKIHRALHQTGSPGHASIPPNLHASHNANDLTRQAHALRKVAKPSRIFGERLLANRLHSASSTI